MRIQKLSEKQGQIFDFAESSEHALICDGAVRSGKTVAMLTAFVIWAMENFENTNFAICGKTVQSAERNLLNPLRQIEGLPYTYKYKISTKTLIVNNGGRENIFYFFGGKDESSYALIQGLTLAGVLFDEVALMPRSFVEQAIARTLSFGNAKLWFNCNPDSPNHWFYKEWIKNPKDNTRHIHFLMPDNPILTKKEIEKAEAMFKGVFYEKYIKGLWVRAEGVVFPDFADNADKYIVDKKQLPKRFKWACMGYDLGGNKSHYGLVVSALGIDNVLYVLRAKEIMPEELRPEDVEKAAIDFIEEAEKDYGIYISSCYIDDTYWTIVNGLNDWRYIFDSAATIKNCMPLIDRPLMLNKLMGLSRFKLVENECEPLIEQLQNAVYDEKKEGTICDDGSMNIDMIDAFFYSIADEYLYLTE